MRGTEAIFWELREKMLAPRFESRVESHSTIHEQAGAGDIVCIV